MKTIKELRKEMNDRSLTIDERAAACLEYRKRIPYCEVCGEKTPVFVKYAHMIVCPKCYGDPEDPRTDDYKWLCDEDI